MSRYPMMTAMDEQTSEEESLRRQAKDWVVQMATGAVTKGDLRALERWRGQSPHHAKAYDEACRLWQALGAPLEAAAREKEGAPGVGRLPGVGRRAFLGGALAASAAAAAGLMIVRPPFDVWPSLRDLTADYHTGVGEQRRIFLADRATIEMNTRTSLNIHGAAGHADSVALLAGEAAVVAGSQRITLVAAEGRTAATDAQFTVRCEAQAVRVTCLGGVVEVACGGRTVALQPRSQVTYAAQAVTPAAPIDPDVVAGWRDGLLVFDDERLSRVIEEVNRYRPGRIILTNAALGEQRVTARFKIARLDAVLTQFQAVFGAKVTPLAGGFVLLG